MMITLTQTSLSPCEPNQCSECIVDNIRSRGLALIIFFRKSQAYIIVYSIDSRLSFIRAQQFHDAMKDITTTHTLFVLVGNKSDLERERQVPLEDGLILARRFGCPFVEVTAKNRQGVEPIFEHLVRALRQRRHQQEQLEEKQSDMCGCIIM